MSKEKDLNWGFWEEEADEINQVQSLNLLLCCNANENEDWLKNQLPDFKEVGRSKNVTELKKVLKTVEPISLAIIMRKSGKSGVDKPEEMAQLIHEHSPDAQIIIIIGKKDGRGEVILQSVEGIGCRTLTADNGPIKAGDILKEVNELAEIARTKLIKKEQEFTDEEKLNVVLVQGTKGGCGETTTIAILGKMLKNAGENVYVVDPSGGLKYINDCLHDCIITPEQIPESGWLFIDKKIIGLEVNFQLTRVIISDTSTEGLVRAKEIIKEGDFVVINRAEPTILPNEIYKGEIHRDPDLIVPYRAGPYFSLEWDEIYEDWMPLFNQLIEKR